MQFGTCKEHAILHVSEACCVPKAVPDQGVLDITLARVWGSGDLQVSFRPLQCRSPDLTLRRKINKYRYRYKHTRTYIWLSLSRFQQRG